MKSYVLLSVSLVLTSCSVMTGDDEVRGDPGAGVGCAEPPVATADAGWVEPTPGDASTWPTPDDAGVVPYPDDASTGPTPDDAGTWPTPGDAGACHHPRHGRCRR